jgi:hypothetical protein
MKKLTLPILLLTLGFAFTNCTKEVKAPVSQTKSDATAKTTNTSPQPTQPSGPQSNHGGCGSHTSSGDGGSYGGH